MNNFIYNLYTYQSKSAHEDEERIKDFLHRIEPFKNAHSISEAKELAEKILPSKDESTSFYIGNLKCTVYNRKNHFKLSIDTPEQFVSYNFVE